MFMLLNTVFNILVYIYMCVLNIYIYIYIYLDIQAYFQYKFTSHGFVLEHVPGKIHMASAAGNPIRDLEGPRGVEDD